MDSIVQKKRFLLGVIFVVIGGIILLGNLHLFPESIYWEIKRLFWHWPMFLIFLGISHFYIRESKFPAIIILLVGVFFMLPHWFNLPFNFREVFWPTIFIIAGITILFRGNRWHRQHRRYCTDEKLDDQDMIDDMAFFGGGEKIITSQNFKGGKITCVFGGFNYQMLRAKLSPGKNEVDVLAVFGGMKLVVPEDWDVKIDVISIFGGFSDKRNISPSALQNKQGEIVLKGMAVFGGGEIKNF